MCSKIFETTRDVLDVISSTNASTNAVISGSDYSVNAIGQRTGISRSGSATPASASATYGYNNRGELITADEATNAQDRAYQFDDIGNRLTSSAGVSPASSTTTYPPNALNQYTAISGGAFQAPSPAYDDDGNATTYPLPVNTAANAALTYDGEHTRRLVGWADYMECSSARSDFSMLGKNHQNRLIKVVTGSTTVEYIYDAFSRRVAKTVGSTRTYYVYDGWNCIAEYTGAVHTTGAAPTPTPTYTHTWGTDLSGSMQRAGGVGGLLQTTAHGSLPTHHYPIYDGNGNITAYIDNSCAIAASFDYDPFGNIVNNNNPQNLPYAFSTKPREPETGLYYYGYRFYDPVTGRWPSRDPIEERGGINVYGYGYNVPLVGCDYLGADWLDYVQGALDAGGCVEPTPFCDLTNAGISACRGNWGDAGCSLAGCIPYLGDGAKLAKYGRKAACARKIDPPAPPRVPDPPPKSPDVDPKAKSDTDTKADKKTKKKDKDECGVNCEVHHIATNKNDISEKEGGPYTPIFRGLFQQAGLNVDEEKTNRCLVCDVGDKRKHKGPHPQAYHAAVVILVQNAVNDTSLDQAAKAEKLKISLGAYCVLLNTPGNPIRLLITVPY